MIPERFQPVLADLAPLADRFAAAGHRLYLVGGVVRDLMAGRELGAHVDLDLTTDALPPQIKQVLAGWADALWTQGERFGTIGARKADRDYEITTHRAEVYTSDSRKPDVSFADAIESDLSRRDFTVNAMALEVTSDTPALVDPVRWRGRPARRAPAAHAAGAGGQLQRRPAAHAAGGAVHRRVRARAGPRAGRSRR